jgi:hypothetical protein
VNHKHKKPKSSPETTQPNAAEALYELLRERSTWFAVSRQEPTISTKELSDMLTLAKAACVQIGVAVDNPERPRTDRAAYEAYKAAERAVAHPDPELSDAERIDWIERHRAQCQFAYIYGGEGRTGWVWKDSAPNWGPAYLTLREAIDAAISRSTSAGQSTGDEK